VYNFVDFGLAERHALRAVGIRASTYRYQLAPGRNDVLRTQIMELAQRHKRYGADMIYIKHDDEAQEKLAN
jgi:hypothetical protein